MDKPNLGINWIPFDNIGKKLEDKDVGGLVWEYIKSIPFVKAIESGGKRVVRNYKSTFDEFLRKSKDSIGSLSTKDYSSIAVAGTIAVVGAAVAKAAAWYLAPAGVAARASKQVAVKGFTTVASGSTVGQVVGRFGIAGALLGAAIVISEVVNKATNTIGNPNSYLTLGKALLGGQPDTRLYHVYDRDTWWKYAIRANFFILATAWIDKLEHPQAWKENAHASNR